MDNCVHKTSSNFYSLVILKDWTSKNESFKSLSPSFDPSLLVSQFRIINYTHLWRPDRLNFFAYKERLDLNHWAVHFIFDNSYSLTQNCFQYFYIAKDDGNRLVLCNEPTKWSHLVEKSQNEVKRTINILLSTLRVDIYTYTDYLPLQQFMLHKDIFPSFDNGIYAQQFYINVDFLEYINLIYKVKETFERNNAVCTTVLYDYFFVKSVKREPSKTLESMKCFQHITKIETTVFFEFKEGYNGFLLQVNVDDKVYFVFFEYYSGFEHNFERTFKNEAYEIETMHAIIDQAMDLTHYGNIREKLTRFMLRSIAELDMLRVITAYYNFSAAIETVIKLQNTLNWFSTDEKTITKRCVNEKSLKLIKQLCSRFQLCKQIDEFTNTILHLLFLYFQHVENHINTNTSAGDKKTRYIFFQPAFYYHDDHIDIKSVVKTQADNQVQLYNE